MAVFDVLRGKTVVATLQGDVPRAGERLVFLDNVYIVYQVDRVYADEYVEDHEPINVPKERQIYVHVNHERVVNAS